jgi:hypothetical protein
MKHKYIVWMDCRDFLIQKQVLQALTTEI